MGLFKILSKKSSKIAKKRLTNVLISDRANCSSATIENLQNEMTYALSKYIEVDAEHIDFKVVLKNNNDTRPQPVLIASIPFVNMGLNNNVHSLSEKNA